MWGSPKKPPKPSEREWLRRKKWGWTSSRGRSPTSGGFGAADLMGTTMEPSKTWWDHGRMGYLVNDDWDLITGWWFQPLWKIWKSIGIIIPYYSHILWKIKAMFQTNNQYIMWNYVIFFILWWSYDDLSYCICRCNFHQRKASPPKRIHQGDPQVSNDSDELGVSPFLETSMHIKYIYIYNKHIKIYNIY